MTSSPWYFLGGGNMATAIIKGYLKGRPKAEVRVIEPRDEARDLFESMGCETFGDLSEVGEMERIVVAVKPQVFPSISGLLSVPLSAGGLVVSIMVGVDSRSIQGALPGRRIVRVMPNTPMMVGEGMSGIAVCEGGTEADYNDVAELFGASGSVLRVPEGKIDDVAAISGSGPAYFFRFCEILVEQAMKVCGFDRADAEKLVAQTAHGSIAYLMSQEGFPVSRLREQVTSPGGTTQAALASFDMSDFEGLVSRGLTAAKDRAEELQNVTRNVGGD